MIRQDCMNRNRENPELRAGEFLVHKLKKESYTQGALDMAKAIKERMYECTEYTTSTRTKYIKMIEEEEKKYTEV